jgi:hypothetical protein
VNKRRGKLGKGGKEGKGVGRERNRAERRVYKCNCFRREKGDEIGAKAWRRRNSRGVMKE